MNHNMTAEQISKYDKRTYYDGIKDLSYADFLRLVYDVDNSYNFQILNPNNSIHDYICPDNTVGSMTKITGNTNSKTWNLTQLDSIKSRYIVGERN